MLAPIVEPSLTFEVQSYVHQSITGLLVLDVLPSLLWPSQLRLW